MQKKNQFKADSRYFTISIYTILTVLVICIIGNLQNSDIKVQTNLIQQTKESIEPYVAMVGTITENRNTEVSDSFIYNLDKVKIMGWKGTVSHGFTSDSGDKIAMMDWKSNESMSVKEYNNFTQSLDEYFGEVAEVQHYSNISSGDRLVWNDLINRCWVLGWYEDDIAYLRWYGKDYWNH